MGRLATRSEADSQSSSARPKSTWVAGVFSVAWSRIGEAVRDAPDEAHDRFGRAFENSHVRIGPLVSRELRS